MNILAVTKYLSHLFIHHWIPRIPNNKKFINTQKYISTLSQIIYVILSARITLYLATNQWNMTEHRGTSFFHSCVKMPVDPCSRQPTPSYERPRLSSGSQRSEKVKKINFAEGEAVENSELSSPRDTLENFLEFLKSIPDYGQVHHLSNEQFKQKVEYLRRKQRLLLENLKSSLDDAEQPPSRLSVSRNETSKSKNVKPDVLIDDLKLSGKKCYLEESRINSPILFLPGSFASLAEDQDLLTYK